MNVSEMRTVYGAFAIVLILVLLASWIKRIAKKHKRVKKEWSDAEKEAVSLQPVQTEIMFPGTVYDSVVLDGTETGSATVLSEVDSVTCRDALGEQLVFTRLMKPSGRSKYREVSYTVTDAVSHSIQMAMPAGQQLYTASALAKMAPNGLFTTSVNPIQLSHFAKDGTFTTMIHGPNGVATHAGFKRIPGFGGFNPVAITAIAFQAMAMISGNYYLSLINRRLNSIENSIQEIMAYHTDKDIGILTYSQRRLKEITGHQTITSGDIDDIWEIKRNVGKLYEQYRIMYAQDEEKVKNYRPEKGNAEKRMQGFNEAVRKLRSTSLICSAAYQIYLQSALVEICVSMKRDAQKAEIYNMISDASGICNMRYTNPDSQYSWIPTKAQEILDTKGFFENIVGINEQKKEQLLSPSREAKTELSGYAGLQEEAKTSEEFLRSLQAPQNALLIPGENGTSPRIFVPV